MNFVDATGESFLFSPKGEPKPVGGNLDEYHFDMRDGNMGKSIHFGGNNNFRIDLPLRFFRDGPELEGWIALTPDGAREKMSSKFVPVKFSK